MTPVIFRKFRSKANHYEVFAIFPTIAGTNDVNTCSSYAAIGQHAACDVYGIISITRLATAEEYGELLGELRRIGYDDLKICSRITAVHHKARRANLKGAA